MSDKVLKLIEDVKALTVLELSELVKALEEEFGVSAARPRGRGRCRCRSRCCRCGREDRVRRDPGGSRR